MVSIKWCCGQKDGIKLIEPNENLADSYIKMAESAMGTMNREREFNSLFAISACYYSMYYSLYAILMKMGIKCEIHSCTLEVMKFALSDIYSEEDVKTIKKAFDARSIVQYYADKFVEKETKEFIMTQAPLFLNKSKEILSKLNENQIKQIRAKLAEIIQSK